MRLTYKRGKLIGFALFFIALGLFGFMFALSPIESRRGLVGLMVALLGPSGTQALMAAFSALLALGGLRLVWLTFDEAVAVELGPRGILVRQIYYTGLLPWAAIRQVDTRIVTGWGKHPMLAIHRAEPAGPVLRMLGLGDKLLVQLKLLDADEHAVHEWIAAARERGGVRRTSAPAQPAAPAVQGFGRRGLTRD